LSGRNSQTIRPQSNPAQSKICRATLLANIHVPDGTAAAAGNEWTAASSITAQTNRTGAAMTSPAENGSDRHLEVRFAMAADLGIDLRRRLLVEPAMPGAKTPKPSVRWMS
jgi:hypothetical protein